LLDFFRRRRPWPQLLRFLERLPIHSHYKAALADDDEYAQVVLSFQHGKPAAPMNMVGYDAVASRLDTVIDVLIAANSTGTPVRMPRPVTAFERIAASNARSRHRQRVAMILSSGSPPTD
jgi:hypothetical protein